MPDDPNPTKKSPSEPEGDTTHDGPHEVEDAARQESEYPSDETNEG